MSIVGIEKFRPNRDGTYGPDHFTTDELYQWAGYDMAKTKRATNIPVWLGVGWKILFIPMYWCGRDQGTAGKTMVMDIPVCR